MKNLALVILLHSFLSVVYAADVHNSYIGQLVGKYYHVENMWAGEEISFVKENDDIIAVWRICGSGLPYVGRPYKTKVTLESSRQLRFRIARDKIENEIIVRVGEQCMLFYIDGIRFYARECDPLPDIRNNK